MLYLHLYKDYFGMIKKYLKIYNHSWHVMMIYVNLKDNI